MPIELEKTSQLIPHPIPYQGSKRALAPLILTYFPEKFETLVEPFTGSAAVSIAAALHSKASHFHLNDINQPLMDLWEEIINRPEELSRAYEKLWTTQSGKEHAFYNQVRAKFNKEKRPDLFLYLLARCVKAAIRYNAYGDFNQSPDNRRKGRHPNSMKRDILTVSKLLKNRTIITCRDYRAILATVSENDLVYMDPSYQGVSLSRDSRYAETIDFDELVDTMKNLVNRNILFILSYDGRTGNKTYGSVLPAELKLHHIEVRVGRSSQSTLLGGKDVTYESIYLSRSLFESLKMFPDSAGRNLSTRTTLQPAISV